MFNISYNFIKHIKTHYKGNSVIKRLINRKRIKKERSTPKNAISRLHTNSIIIQLVKVLINSKVRLQQPYIRTQLAIATKTGTIERARKTTDLTSKDIRLTRQLVKVLQYAQTQAYAPIHVYPTLARHVCAHSVQDESTTFR